MLGFLFRSIKMLIIWIVIGIIAAYAYSFAKPYFINAEPIVKQSIQKIAKKADEVKKIEAIKQVIDKAVEKAETMKNSAAVEKKEVPKVNKIEKVQVAKRDATTAKENELFDRQMSIVNELMN